MKQAVNRKLLFCSFLCFFLILIWILSFKANKEIPISDCIIIFSKYPVEERILIGCRNLFSRIGYVDIIQNIIVFIPLGIYLPLLFKKDKFVGFILLGLILSLLIELMQAITCVGSFNLWDIFVNTCGGIFGLLIYKLLIKILSYKTINIINIVIIALATPVVIYAIVNTIINFEIYKWSTYL